MGKWRLCGVCAALVPAAALLWPWLQTPFREILLMHLFPGNRHVQLQGCGLISHFGYRQAQVPMKDTGSPEQKDMAKVGGIEAVMKAVRNFPRDGELNYACLKALGGLTLWSVPNGNYAGSLGGVDLILQQFQAFAHDANLMIGGALGCLFDFCPRNRRRFAELGGPKIMADLLRRHYNHTTSVLETWYGFSSGTYDNARLFEEAGLVELGVQSMIDYAGAFRVREEVLQAFKAASVDNEGSRSHVAAAGAPLQYVRTLRENVTDPQVTSLVCENMAVLVGGDTQIWSVRGYEGGYGPKNETTQRHFVELGAPEALVIALKQEKDMQLRHLAHGYNVLPDCLQALAALADGHDDAKQWLLKADAAPLFASFFRERTARFDHLSERVKHNACKLLKHLASASPESVAPHMPPECSRSR